MIILVIIIVIIIVINVRYNPIVTPLEMATKTFLCV